jgi:catechol 2,3-dioxygenase-like lactoylglutathione lyase family enzyme
MSVRFVNPLPFVADLARSVAFYEAALGLAVAEAHDDFVRFSGGFALHDGASLLRQALDAQPDHRPYGRDNLILYFEADDLEQAFIRAASRAEIVHPPKQQEWGGIVFRCRDPDGHLVEVGQA